MLRALPSPLQVCLQVHQHHDQQGQRIRTYQRHGQHVRQDDAPDEEPQHLLPIQFHEQQLPPRRLQDGHNEDDDADDEDEEHDADDEDEPQQLLPIQCNEQQLPPRRLQDGHNEDDDADDEDEEHNEDDDADDEDE